LSNFNSIYIYIFLVNIMSADGNPQRKLTGHGVGSVTFANGGRKFSMHSVDSDIQAFNPDADNEPSAWRRFRYQADGYRQFLAQKCCGWVASVPSLALLLITMFLIMILIASVPLAFFMLHHNSAALTSDDGTNVNVPETVHRFNMVWQNDTKKTNKGGHSSLIKASFIIPRDVDTCRGFGFSCTSTPSHVIGTNSRCDGHVDCDDASDELDCSKCKTAFSCLFSDVSTKTKLCLRGEQLCDGHKSCTDGSDEAICGITCAKDQMKCHKGNTTICVSEEMICDGDKHCTSGRDEKDCSSCKNGAKFCQPTNQCIPAWELCDGKRNCPDGSDETDCDCFSCSGIDKALCKESKVCIEKHQICDGHLDCPEGEDEKNCPGSCPQTSSRMNKTLSKRDVPDSSVTCADGKSYSWRHACSGLMIQCVGSCETCNNDLAFQCDTNKSSDGKTIAKCIPRANVCDGKVDCIDGTDEAEAECACDSFKLRCTSHTRNPLLKERCYSKDQHCDGYKDCPNGDDEKQCAKCSGESFKCLLDEQCIQGIYRCDGIENCEDGSDEAGCSCEECTRHPFPMYMCGNADRCFRTENVCTPKTNCPNATKSDLVYCAFRSTQKGFKFI